MNQHHITPFISKCKTICAFYNCVLCFEVLSFFSDFQIFVCLCLNSFSMFRMPERIKVFIRLGSQLSLGAWLSWLTNYVSIFDGESLVWLCDLIRFQLDGSTFCGEELDKRPCDDLSCKSCLNLVGSGSSSRAGIYVR